MNALFAAIAAMLVLTGCTPEVFMRYELVEQRTMVIATFDESLLEPCHETMPPAPETYTLSNRDRKEALLTSYAADLVLDNKRCSLDKATLKAQLERQKLSIQKYNDDEEARVKRLIGEKERKKE